MTYVMFIDDKYQNQELILLINAVENHYPILIQGSQVVRNP
jgi:hypothetical protein